MQKNRTEIQSTAFACFLVSLLTGCHMIDQRPTQIQFCLSRGFGDEIELKRVFQEISIKEKIEYFDWSKETQKQLESLDDAEFHLRKSFPIINIAIRRRDGMGVGGGNSGLPANQVTFGFTDGRDEMEAHRFANRVIKRLSETWKVHRLPNGRGAFPSGQCT